VRGRMAISQAERLEGWSDFSICYNFPNINARVLSVQIDTNGPIRI
jgi:hypothetical protein